MEVRRVLFLSSRDRETVRAIGAGRGSVRSDRTQGHGTAEDSAALGARFFRRFSRKGADGNGNPGRRQNRRDPESLERILPVERHAGRNNRKSVVWAKWGSVREDLGGRHR